jgi:hypothetical protein
VARNRILVLTIAYFALVTAGIYAGHWLADLAEMDLRPIDEPPVQQLIAGAVVAFVLASAVPFVPGAEIGLALMMVLGSKIVPLVYLGMVLALALAFVVGRLIPAQLAAACFGFVGLERARHLVLRIAPLDVEARLQTLIARAPRHVVPFLLRHRHIALAVALNLPGNTLIGGGGGIALVAGMSGIYTPGAYLATVALAVAPIPICFLAFGAGG